MNQLKGFSSGTHSQDELAYAQLVHLSLLITLDILRHGSGVLLVQRLHFVQLDFGVQSFFAHLCHVGLCFAQVHHHALLQVQQLAHDLAVVPARLHAHHRRIPGLFLQPVLVV